MAPGSTSTAAQGPPPRKDEGDDKKKEDKKKEDPKKFDGKIDKGKRKAATLQKILDRDENGESIITATKHEIRWSYEQQGMEPRGQ